MRIKVTAYIDSDVEMALDDNDPTGLSLKAYEELHHNLGSLGLVDIEIEDEEY